jgi:beta-phosphoglucomutase family hydrolase
MPLPEPDLPRAVLWDLDGTLIDSHDHHYEAWREISVGLGYPMSEEIFVGSFGKRNDTILRELLGDGPSAIEVQRIGDEKERLYRRLVRERGVPLLPGARTWLDRLAVAGWRQAIASSAPHANIEAVLEPLGLHAFFDAVVSADDVGRGKPDPHVFLTAAERVAVPSSRCVVVEDAPAGLEGARRAGMRSIGVLSSHDAGLEADVVVPSLTALAADAFDLLLRPA